MGLIVGDMQQVVIESLDNPHHEVKRIVEAAERGFTFTQGVGRLLAFGNIPHFLQQTHPPLPFDGNEGGIHRKDPLIEFLALQIFSVLNGACRQRALTDLVDLDKTVVVDNVPRASAGKILRILGAKHSDGGFIGVKN